ncbi:hypothetical protein [Sporomusa aerivorans]|uniref:hypothetical protein n=1 Tax=Sporomusa aerivorans TaxID=204936 RepID=UPI00352B3744
MKKLVLPVILVLTLIVFSGLASAAGLTIINKTGFDICEMHFVAGDESYWGDNVLKRTAILNDETVTVNWDKGDKSLWNIMVVDEHNRKFYWWKLNLNEGTRIILKPDRTAAFQ